MDVDLKKQKKENMACFKDTDSLAVLGGLKCRVIQGYRV